MLLGFLKLNRIPFLFKRKEKMNVQSFHAEKPERCEKGVNLGLNHLHEHASLPRDGRQKVED